MIQFYAGKDLPGKMSIGKPVGSATIDRGSARIAFNLKIEPEEVAPLLEAIRRKWSEPIEGSSGQKATYSFGALQGAVSHPGVLELPADTWTLRANGGGGDSFLPVPASINRALGMAESSMVRDYFVDWCLCPSNGYVSIIVGRWES